MNVIAKLMQNKQKIGNAKQVLFVIVRGRTYGCVYMLQRGAKILKKLNVRVYVIMLGTRILKEELTMMTNPGMVFMATKQEHLVKGNNDKPAILKRIAHRLVRCTLVMLRPRLDWNGSTARSSPDFSTLTRVY